MNLCECVNCLDLKIKDQESEIATLKNELQTSEDINDVQADTIRIYQRKLSSISEPTVLNVIENPNVIRELKLKIAQMEDEVSFERERFEKVYCAVRDAGVVSNSRSV